VTFPCGFRGIFVTLGHIHFGRIGHYNYAVTNRNVTAVVPRKMQTLLLLWGVLWIQHKTGPMR
jgi:hypothetical protein